MVNKTENQKINIIALARFLCEHDDFNDYIFCKLQYIL